MLPYLLQNMKHIMRIKKGKKDDDVSLSESEKFLADVVQHHQNENINIA